MPSAPAPLIPFRRKDFYELTFFCRTYAMELARMGAKIASASAQQLEAVEHAMMALLGLGTDD